MKTYQKILYIGATVLATSIACSAPIGSKSETVTLEGRVNNEVRWIDKDGGYRVYDLTLATKQHGVVPVSFSYTHSQSSYNLSHLDAVINQDTCIKIEGIDPNKLKDNNKGFVNVEVYTAGRVSIIACPP